jgi:hypothetical protein
MFSELTLAVVTAAAFFLTAVAPAHGEFAKKG